MDKDKTSQRNEELWTRAFEQLEPKEKSMILDTGRSSPATIEETLRQARAKREKAISKQWKFTKSNGDVIILRDVFEKIVRWVSKYTEVVGIVANTDPVHAGLPWAFIRMLLQASSSDLQLFGSLAEGIELVARLLVRYRIIEKGCFPPAPVILDEEQQYLSECITNIYTAMLKYLAMANRYWGQKSAVRIAKGIFVNLEAGHSTLQQAISNADDEASRTANLIQNRDIYNTSKRTQETLAFLLDEIRLGPSFRIARDVSGIEDHLSQDQRKEALQWLSTVEWEEPHHKSCEDILKGTGQWLLEHPAFLDWLNSSVSTIFWLNGIPGSGKSKLTSIVIESMLEQQAQEAGQRPPVAYFYCSKKSNDPRTADPKEILCALLHQLAGSDVHLPLRGNLGQDFQKRKKLASRRGLPILPLKTQEIVKRIVAIAEEDPIVLILDALDEVDEVGRGGLFDALEQILQEAQNVVKIFTSSRNDGDIVERFEQYANVRINSLLIEKDMQHFIQAEVNKAIKSKSILRGRVSPSLHDAITQTLTEKAQGMFRWVELSVQMLSSRRLAVEKDVRSKLGRLPVSLKEQYAEIYSEILESESSTAAIAGRVFSWMLAAQRALTVEELIAAVALDDDGYYHHDLDVPRLLDICRNLVVVVSLDNKSSSKSFQVAHLSVKEYLLELPEYSTERIHTHALLRCLQVFGVSGVENQTFPRRLGDADQIRDYTIYLFEHARRSELTNLTPRTGGLVQSFLFDENFEPTIMLREWADFIDTFLDTRSAQYDSDRRLLWNLRSTKYSAGGLYLICYYDLLGVLNLVGSVAGMPLQRCCGFSTLSVAVQNGSLRVAKWLLENRINDANGIEDPPCDGIPMNFALYSNSAMVAPLQGNNGTMVGLSQGKDAVVDSSWGDSAMVDLLLEYGANPLHLGNESFFYTALRHSIYLKNLPIFRKLLNSIKHLNKAGASGIASLAYDWRHYALRQAIISGLTPAVELLLAQGADVFAYVPSTDIFNSYPQSTTLQIAVQLCDIAAVKMLIKAASRYEEDAKAHKFLGSSLLLNNTKSYVNVVDKHRHSAIHYLMGRHSKLSHESGRVMKLLLENGADVNIVCDKGYTALHVATVIGPTSLLQDLLQRWVEMQELPRKKVPAPCTAARERYQESSAMHHLIGTGISPYTRDENGWIAIFYATSFCNLPALEALLEKMLAVTSPVENETLLPNSSSQVGNEHGAMVYDRVKCLFNTRDNDGNAPLHVVARGSSMLKLHRVRNFSSRSDDEIWKAEASEVQRTIEWLLSQNADINQRNKQGRTPLSMAVSLPPHSAIVAVRVLLVKGANPHLPDLRGRSPIHYAHCIETMEDLIRAGDNIEAKDNLRCTPLHLVSVSRNPKLASLLLRYNATPSAMDIHGATPLHYAAENRHSGCELITILVGANANINAVDNARSTPLHYAAKAGCLPPLRTLLDAGARPDILDQCGESAMSATAWRASTIPEGKHSYYYIPFLKIWYELYRASQRKRAEQRSQTQRCPLQRSQSMKYRVDQSWGNFTQVRAKEIASLDKILLPEQIAVSKYKNVVSKANLREFSVSRPMKRLGKNAS